MKKKSGVTSGMKATGMKKPIKGKNVTVSGKLPSGQKAPKAKI